MQKPTAMNALLANDLFLALNATMQDTLRNRVNSIENAFATVVALEAMAYMGQAAAVQAKSASDAELWITNAKIAGKKLADIYIRNL